MIQIGDVVYLKSDLKLKHPMTVTNADPYSDIGYVVKWLSSQGKEEVGIYGSPDVFVKAVEAPEVTYIPNKKK